MNVELLVALGLLGAGLSAAAVIAVVLGVSACVSVVRDARLSGGAKTMWVAMIALFPIFGPVVYFAVRGDW